MNLNNSSPSINVITVASTQSKFNASNVFVRSILSLLMIPVISGCGYTMGPQNEFGVRSVQVKTFGSDADRRGFEYLLTEAVQNEIKRRSSFLLLNDASADSVLEGRLVNVQKDVLTETQFDDPRALQLTIGVELTWLDRRNNRILWQDNVPIKPDVRQMLARSDFSPEVGHSLATATQTAIDRLATQIVDRMELPW